MSSNVPFQDLGRLHGSIRAELDEAIANVVDQSSFVGARSCRQFETAFAAAHDAPHAVGVGSGTDALALALRAMDIGPGDEVIVPSMTFVATAEAVAHVGATPIVVDVEADSLLLGVDQVARARSERTAAVIAVHLYGHCVDFELIQSWRNDGLRVIEDAAQAHLATFEGEFVGSAGDAACFSFYPGKNLGAFGDGGAVVTHDEGVAARVAQLRDHGRVDKYRHDEIGWCSRLDGLQAAVLEVKLRHLPRWTASRRDLADRYQERLGDRLVPWREGAVHHLLVVRAGRGRDMLREDLQSVGISTGIHYPLSLSQQPSMAPFLTSSTPHADVASGEILSLPMDPLMTTAEVDRVCDELERLTAIGRSEP